MTEIHVETEGDFAQRIAFSIGNWPDKLALVCDRQIMTYRDLGIATGRICNGLIAKGLVAGRSPRIGVLAANCLEYACVIAAAYRGGFCIVPIPGLIAPDAQARMIIDAEIGVLFASSELAAKATAALNEIDRSSWPVRLGFDFADDIWSSYEAWLEQQPSSYAGEPVDPGWEANLIYSSGTTGTPKGIVHTHAAREALHMGFKAFGFGADTQIIVPINFYSNHGIVAETATLFWGGTMLFMRKFSTRQFLNFYRDHRPNIAWLVPAVLVRVLAEHDFDGAVGKTWTFKTCAGAPLTAAQKQEVLDRWPGPFIEIYGQSETGVVSTLNANDAPATKLGSIGQVASSCSVRIIDEDGKVVDQGVIGEIAARTPALMSAYHARPDATAEAFWSDALEVQYKRTGDMGHLDSDGFLWLSDRKSEMIISGGYNVFTADVERVLADHPVVLEVAVVGVPSDRWGETPVACVRLREGEQADPELLKDWANARLGEIQRVAEVVLYDELPAGTLGKILKRQLRVELAARNVR